MPSRYLAIGWNICKSLSVYESVELWLQTSFGMPGMSSSPTAPQMTRTSSGRQISVAPNLNTVIEGDETGDGSPSGNLAGIPLDDDDTHAIVRVLEHLIANYRQLSDAPNSPLYKGPRTR